MFTTKILIISFVCCVILLIHHHKMSSLTLGLESKRQTSYFFKMEIFLIKLLAQSYFSQLNVFNFRRKHLIYTSNGRTWAKMRFRQKFSKKDHWKVYFKGKSVEIFWSEKKSRKKFCHRPKKIEFLLFFKKKYDNETKIQVLIYFSTIFFFLFFQNREIKMIAKFF